MAVNRGKQFEGAVEKSLSRIPNTAVIRLIDPQAGYAGVRNVCDFVVYHRPTLYMLECKSVHGNRLSIHNNDPKRKHGDITNTQWDGLLEYSTHRGVVCGYLIWFIDHDKTVFVTAEQMRDLYDRGSKGFNISMWTDDDWFHIEGEKKRILFDYDFTEFFERFSD